MSGRAPGDVAQRLARLTGAGVSELRLIGSQHHYRYMPSAFVASEGFNHREAQTILKSVFD